jgi:ribonucleoside-diphosphate reductase beta chain
MINKSILNTEKTDYGDYPLFLGDQEMGLFDTINKKYPVIWDYYKEMRSLDWSEDEFDFSSCNLMFKTCPDHITSKMIKTLAWQWEADSIASKSLYAVMAPFISSPELMALWQRVSENEIVHAATYSEIVRMSFDNPNDVLDEVLKVEEAMSRLETVSEVFSTAYTTSHNYALGNVENNQSTYEDVFMFLVALYGLEAIQFMSSFAITFAICDSGLFQPIGKAVQKIAQDEYEVHKESVREILKIELKTERGKTALVSCKDKIEKLLNEVVDNEMSWLDDTLFADDKELVGVNASSCGKWTLYNAKPVFNLLNVKCNHPFPQKNPLKFMENWLDMSKTQPAPQEEDVAAYKVGMIKRTDEGKVFDVDF